MGRILVGEKQEESGGCGQDLPVGEWLGIHWLWDCHEQPGFKGWNLVPSRDTQGNYFNSFIDSCVNILQVLLRLLSEQSNLVFINWVNRINWPLWKVPKTDVNFVSPSSGVSCSNLSSFDGAFSWIDVSSCSCWRKVRHL